MDIPDPWSWVIIGVCVLLHFFFSMSETALSCCNRFKIQVLADSGKKSAKLVIRLLNKFDRALTTVLIGTNIAAIVISMVSTMCFLRYFNAAGYDNEFVISLISSLLMSLLVYIVGDALPKTIARSIPDTLSLTNVYPIYVLCFIFTYIIPIALLFDLLVKLIGKIFKVKDSVEFTEDDFEDTVDKVIDEGVLEEEQAEIIQSALEFNDTKVQQILTKKENMFALDITDLTHEKLNQILLECSYSRIPVYEKEFDNFIGVLHIKTYFKEMENNPNIPIKATLTKPYFVTPNIMIDDLFIGFKKHHTHLALVKNIDNKIIGMVTMEDVLEEIVEDIGENYSSKERNKPSYESK